MGSHLLHQIGIMAAQIMKLGLAEQKLMARALDMDVAWGAAPPVELSEADVKADLPRLVVDPPVPTAQNQPTAEVDVVIDASGTCCPNDRQVTLAGSRTGYQCSVPGHLAHGRAVSDISTMGKMS